MTLPRLSTLAAAALAAALLAACGDEPADRLGSDAGPSAPTPTTSLVVTVADREAPNSKREWTLTCDPAGGTHPDAAGACQALASADDAFAPVPRDAVCTQVYGGSGVATVTGTWRGQAVDARFSRENGCHIARWEKVGALLPGPIPGMPGDPEPSASPS